MGTSKCLRVISVLITIPDLLNEPQIQKLREILAEGQFVDGKLTAGMAARRVKNNEEIQPSPELTERLNRIVMASVAQNARFRSATLPNRMADFIFARYQPSMTYGGGW
jgi:PKHD-type hydroxylase